MPLIHKPGQGAFQQNVSTLMGEIGKSPHVKSRAQALAVAYSIQRRGHADGGRFQDGGLDDPAEEAQRAREAAARRSSHAWLGFRGPMEGGTLRRQLTPESSLEYDRRNLASAIGAAIDPMAPNPVPTTGHYTFWSGVPGAAVQGMKAMRAVPSMARSVMGAIGRNPEAAAGAGTLLGLGGMRGLSQYRNRPSQTAEDAQPDYGRRSLDPVTDSYAAGGNVPWFVRNEARDLDRYGMVNGTSSGRGDNRAMGLRPQSYVVPADIVSGLGQGNSAAGANVLGKMFKMGPYGTQGVQAPRPMANMMPGMNTMRQMRRGHFAEGGEVSVKVSDGEFLIPPEKVAEIGGGDHQHGHDILDQMVLQQRQKLISHLSSLPPPKGSQAREGAADGGPHDRNWGYRLPQYDHNSALRNIMPNGRYPMPSFNEGPQSRMPDLGRPYSNYDDTLDVHDRWRVPHRPYTDVHDEEMI